MRPSLALRTALLAGATVLGACAGGGASPGEGTNAGTAPSTATTAAVTSSSKPRTTTSATSVTTAADPADPYAVAGWTAAENARPGDPGWRITGSTTDHVADNPQGWIEGFAGAVTARHGDSVPLYVDTPAATFTVRAYRMGFYGGAMGRLIWQSDPVAGARQAMATFDGRTHMAEAPWQVSTEVPVTAEWPPGAYLLRLDSDAGGAHYVPLTVRHDAAAADLLFMNAVTTWQAYNPWGGCTLYECFEPRSGARADVVSFDRPYAHSYGFGAADFLTHELPLLAFAEEQGYDVAYVTNIDLHADPAVATQRPMLLSPGHDEYYSAPMRAGLEAALDGGTNIAFFGANAVYRNIRLEPGADGAPYRREVNYRVSDPGAGGDPELQTVNWRESPLRRNEAEIVGLQYGCAEVRRSMRLVNTGSWLFDGADVSDGALVRNLVGVEFDEMAAASVTPADLEVIAATSLECRELTYQQVSAYHTRPSGAGVFAAGTINWGCALFAAQCDGIDRAEVIRVVTANVLRVFTAGPAGLTHPGSGNYRSYRAAVHEPVDPPRRGGGGGGTTTTTTTPSTDPPPTDPPPTDPPPTDPPVTDPPPPPTV